MIKVKCLVKIQHESSYVKISQDLLSFIIYPRTPPFPIDLQTKNPFLLPAYIYECKVEGWSAC